MNLRMPNLFEKILLVIGILVVMIGYGMIYRVFQADPTLSWSSLTVIFLWLVLICLVIMISVMENMKEELKAVVENQLSETKLMREELRQHRK